MTRPPNIVFILADDLGYGDISCLNPQSRINTPHHDRLAREGISFTDAHSSSAVCTPTRYSVLTGRYCWRTRLKNGVLWGYSPPLIEPDRTTVASLLKAAGYATACVGKWHLGLGWQTRRGVELVDPPVPHDPGVLWDQPLTAGPHTVGFDYSCIIAASLDMPPYCFIENGRVIEPQMRACGDRPRPAMYRGGLISRGFEHETCLLELTRRAEQWIVDQSRSAPQQPFFLYFPTTSPHTPHLPRPPFVGATDIGPYGDFVTEHDWCVGQILAALDRSGLAENTLVIVTSDNGPHKSPLHLESRFGHHSTHIYRGQKSDVWDGGHRVPFLARWPGVVHAGTTCDSTICLTDLLATCAAIAHQPLGAEAGEDSINLLPYLRGEACDAPLREATVHHSVEGYFAIRQGPWKLVLAHGSGGWSLPESQAQHLPTRQLYHLKDDPAEQHNVVAQHPSVVSELEAKLQQYRQHDRSVPVSRSSEPHSVSP